MYRGKKESSGRADTPLWEDRWARFARGLTERGVEVGKHEFHRAWVRQFFSFLKPRRLHQAERGDVESFLTRLVEKGKAGWQVHQASQALELFCREVMPLDWAQRGWPETPKAGAPGLTQRAQEEVGMRGTQEEGQSKEDEAAGTLHQRAGQGSRRDAGMAGLVGTPNLAGKTPDPKGQQERKRRAAELPRPPVEGARVEALRARSDQGELPVLGSGWVEAARERLRTLRYAFRTEQTYLAWIERFLVFAGTAEEQALRRGVLEDYLDYLALVRRVSAGTQNQALNAVLFFFKEVLGRPAGALEDVVRAPVSRRIPVVLSRGEVMRLLAELSGPNQLAGQLMYGAGLRVMECMRLRVQDVDFDQELIVVREGKGGKDRMGLIAKERRNTGV
jgi:hypothetical protein